MSDIAIPALLDRLDAGVSVLLPSGRAAAELRAAYDVRRQVRGDAAWGPAPVYSWTQWAGAQWSGLVVAGAEQRLLLNAAQELAVWREIVVEAPAGEAALGPADAPAQMAREAWTLAAAFRAVGQLRAAANTHDSGVFAAWAEAFMRRCAGRGYLSAALLEEALRQHLESGAFVPPREIALVGFAEETPAQQSLLAALEQRGTDVHRYRQVYAAEAGSPVRAWTVAASEQEELTLAARWIRSRLEEHAAFGRDARVGVLLPRRSQDRHALESALEAALRDVLAPELNAVDADMSSTPWEFSTGPALAALPMVSSALGLARWAAHALPLDAVTALLLSPCVGHNAATAEREASARFDANVLRRTPSLREERTLAQVLALAERADRPPAVIGCLRDAQSVLQRAGDLLRPRAFADWGEFVRDLTRAANWPGDRVLNATEFEATRAWDSLLDMLATLDFQGRRVPFAVFLEELEQQARATAFVPPATHAPVQVMGVHEAEGCLFDAVVLLRATDANWPQSERMQPLIAWPLQRGLGMPGTDPAQTNAHARTAAVNLLDRCGSVLCTLAEEDADGPLRPSPLIGAMGLRAMAAADLVLAAGPVATVGLEAVADDAPLPALPSSEVFGGARVLQLQAHCGFQAFAEFRLHARKLETIEFGLDAPESGRRMHGALQLFWKKVKTQDNLRSLSGSELDGLLRECVHQSLRKHLPLHGAWDNAFIHLQEERLVSLLRQWLAVELQRGPFTVLDSEQEQYITVGPLTMQVRLDRIDQVPGGFVLVDYKTGISGHPSHWEGERPDDPQLPLYALLDTEDELKGLAFAKVRAEEMKWLGCQSEPGILPASRVNQVVEDMPGLVAGWRGTLVTLAEDFAAGHAEVDPKRYPMTCEHCSQRVLCRVQPAMLSLRTVEEAEAPDG